MKYGCIGEHLKHSFSKEIHNKIGTYEYEIREVPKQALDGFMKGKEFCGINVTIPYKQDVIPYLYKTSETAREIGAVNTIVNRDGLLFGYNTDFSGMKALILKSGIEFKGKKVLILGTGGTSKTALAAAKSLEAKKIYRVGRTGSNGSLTYEEAYLHHSDAEVVINTTPCGMFPDIFASPIDTDGFPKLEGIVDCIYNPLRTRLVSEALKKGIKATGGLYMLVAQAVFAAEKFTDTHMGDEITDSIYSNLLSEKQNIVLIGMPGSGKTTIGKIIAEMTGKPFIDCDEYIAQKHGMTPENIITEMGQEKFRDIESEAVRELAPKSGCIIATGGGTVLREENIFLLKQNGRMFFINRPINEIVPTSDRPLSDTRAELEKRYSERYEIYCEAADKIIPTDGGAAKTAHRITESDII